MEPQLLHNNCIKSLIMVVTIMQAQVMRITWMCHHQPPPHQFPQTHSDLGSNIPRSTLIHMSQSYQKGW